MDHSMPVLYHGTTLSIATIIGEEGFKPGSYFTTSFDDALHYAGCGGEADLEIREREWEEANGYSPRDDYGPDLWLMFEHLYPAGDRPAVIAVEINEETLANGTADTGGEGGVRLDTCANVSIIRIETIDWDEANNISYNPFLDIAEAELILPRVVQSQ